MSEAETLNRRQAGGGQRAPFSLLFLGPETRCCRSGYNAWRIRQRAT
ncbi:MAG: hypothetical protein WDM81_14635 [Rhizomicrobium sp.]